MREQRKACAWGWQPVCNSGLQSSECGTTSLSRLLWPKKFGKRISEYPTSLQTCILWGMATQRVDWPMSNASKGQAIVIRATVKKTAIMSGSESQTRRGHKDKQGELSFFLSVSAEMAWYIYSKVSQPHESVVLLSTTNQRCRDVSLEITTCFVMTADDRGGRSKQMVCGIGGRGGGNTGESQPQLSPLS